MPLPSDDTTPPVMNTYRVSGTICVSRLRIGHPVRPRCSGTGTERTVAGGPDGGGGVRRPRNVSVTRSDWSDMEKTEKVVKSEQEWRAELTPDQYAVLRNAATEPPWAGKYVSEKGDGIYRCAGCGNELFSSETKFESGSGWPSFTDPVFGEAVVAGPGLRRGRRDARGPLARDGAYRGRVRALRRAPRARVRRRPGAERR